MADSSGNSRIEGLRKTAVEKGIDLPKAKKDSIREVQEAFETAELEAASGEPKNKKTIDKEALKILEKKLGVKKKKPAAAKRKAEAEPSAPSVLDEVWDVSSKEERKKRVTQLVDVAKARGIRLPEDEQAARMGLGTAIMGCKQDGKVKVKDAVESLVDKYGRDPAWVDPDETAPKKKRPSKAKQCACPENKDMAEAFDELAGLYFKEGSKAGGVYKKVVSAIKDMPEPLLAPPKKGQVPGIGPKTIQKIDEFLKTGKMQILEEKRAESVM